MGDIVLASMLSAFVIVCLMVAFVIGLVIFMIGILFEKDIKKDEHNVKIIVMLAKFITFLLVLATILEILAVYIK